MLDKSIDSLVISSRDYENLIAITEKNPTSAMLALDEELARAEVINTGELPGDVVAMNSFVSFVDLDSKEKTTVKLVYPSEANADERKISILSPVGTALIGLRVGGKIDWPLPNGKICRLQVVSVNQSAAPLSQC